VYKLERDYAAFSAAWTPASEILQLTVAPDIIPAYTTMNVTVAPGQMSMPATGILANSTRARISTNAVDGPVTSTPFHWSPPIGAITHSYLSFYRGSNATNRGSLLSTQNNLYVDPGSADPFESPAGTAVTVDVANNNALVVLSAGDNSLFASGTAKLMSPGTTEIAADVVNGNKVVTLSAGDNAIFTAGDDVMIDGNVVTIASVDNAGTASTTHLTLTAVYPGGTATYPVWSVQTLVIDGNLVTVASVDNAGTASPTHLTLTAPYPGSTATTLTVYPTVSSGTLGISFQ
jgi:hypothetical protein